MRSRAPLFVRHARAAYRSTLVDDMERHHLVTLAAAPFAVSLAATAIFRPTANVMDPSPLQGEPENNHGAGTGSYFSPHENIDGRMYAPL